MKKEIADMKKDNEETMKQIEEDAADEIREINDKNSKNLSQV